MCPSSVFCPVLSLVDALTFCWPQIQEGPSLCICLGFWYTVCGSTHRRQTHGHLGCKVPRSVSPILGDVNDKWKNDIHQLQSFFHQKNVQYAECSQWKRQQHWSRKKLIHRTDYYPIYWNVQRRNIKKKKKQCSVHMRDIQKETSRRPRNRNQYLYVRSIGPGCWGTYPTTTQGGEWLSRKIPGAALWTSSPRTA